MEIAEDNYFSEEEGYKAISELVDRYSEANTKLKDLQKQIQELLNEF